MLWESVDPVDTLSKRFGFADADVAVSWMTDTLLDTWAVAVEDCDRLIMSVGNLLAWIPTSDERRLIPKWSVFPKLFQRLADTTALCMWLHDSGVPVAAPIPAGDGRLRVEQDNVSIGVVPVIDGDLLDVGDPAQVAAGHMLATLHDAMVAYPHRIDGGPST
jgi:homoserine kinase type II